VSAIDAGLIGWFLAGAALGALGGHFGLPFWLVYVGLGMIAAPFVLGVAANVVDKVKSRRDG